MTGFLFAIGFIFALWLLPRLPWMILAIFVGIADLFTSKDENAKEARQGIGIAFWSILALIILIIYIAG